MTEKDEAVSSEIVTAAVLVIGDEILSGRTKDKNIGAIADHLTAIGIRLGEVRIVPDEPGRIIPAVNALRSAYDYVFTTGGIGPTHDDITADCIAQAFGARIDINTRAVAMLAERYSEEELTAARLRMARIPEGAALIANAVSKAPGFMIGNVVVMAGVPNIMRAMLDAVTPALRTGLKLVSASITVEAPEGEIADILAAAQAAHPGVPMGSYPFFEEGRWGANLVLRCVSEEKLAAAKAHLEEALIGGGVKLRHEGKA